MVLLLLPQSLWSQEPKRVLFISSYHPAFPTFFQQVDGVKSIFSDQPVLLDIDFLDSKRFPARQTFVNFYNLLREKLKRLPPYDALIVADDNALTFAMEYQQDLFPNLPIVFLGVNNIDLALQQNSNPLITGVVEAVSMEDTLSLILALHPKTTRIVALVDGLPSGQADLKSFYRLRGAFPGVGFEEISLARQTFATFADQLKTLGVNDVALLLSAYQDSSGKTLRFNESIKLISENLSRPLYHLWEHGMGQGVLGGRLISHFEQGVRAAEIVTAILSGTPVSSIPVDSQSPNRYTFDYHQMEKFGIAKSLLPNDSKILNLPNSFYYQYRQAIWLSGLIFVGYSLLVIGLLNNIRTRKKAEDELKNSENRLKALIDLLPIGLVLCEMDGSIVTANRAYNNIVGYSADEILQCSYWDITPEQYESNEQEQLVKMAATGCYGPYEKEYLHKNGYLVPVRLNGIVLKQDGKQYIWSSVEDITTLREKENLEEQLRQSQKMEAIGTLAGGVAHDFNNILAAILGYTELVLRDKDTSERSRKKLEQVTSAAKRATELVKQILMFSRKENVERKNICIDKVVSETVQLLKKTIPATVTINFYSDSEPKLILANETQMHQVVMNLCTNAFHSMPGEQGTIKVQLRKVRVGLSLSTRFPHLNQGDYILLQVADNGSGMPAEVVKRIFEPFYTTKKQGQGTGMGLAMVHGIIENHGGVIGVESTVGKGSIFNIYLPVVSEATECELSPKEEISLHGAEHILFVDDEPALADLGKATLESFGFKVTVTSSARDALTLFTSDPGKYAAVVSDQTMPGMTGDVFAQKTLNLRPDIPIIICTGHSEVLNAEKARALGIRALLQKPVSGETLVAELRKAIDGTHQRS